MNVKSFEDWDIADLRALERAITAEIARREANARYRHPQKASLIWSGEPPAPPWVRKWLREGFSLDSLEVPGFRQQEGYGATIGPRRISS
jgi:hypothetical protein